MRRHDFLFITRLSRLTGAIPGVIREGGVKMEAKNKVLDFKEELIRLLFRGFMQIEFLIDGVSFPEFHQVYSKWTMKELVQEYKILKYYQESKKP